MELFFIFLTKQFLFHHLFSTYYSQERWCAGSSSLTAANIKKDITIFGVKGTYEGSLVWLVKDGYLASGRTVKSSYSVYPNSDSNWWEYNDINTTYWGTTYNNKHWFKLYQWESKNGVRRYDTAFNNIIGTLVTLSSGRINGVIGGDFYGTGLSKNSPKLCYMITYNGSEYNGTMTPALSASGTAEFSFTQTGVTVRSYHNINLRSGDISITAGSDDGFKTIYAYNLWINKTS